MIVRKDAGLNIRIEKRLRRDFLEICRVEDKPAAQVLREFMRSYVKEHRELLQGMLFRNQGKEAEK
jgi:hypothetical protein